MFKINKKAISVAMLLYGPVLFMVFFFSYSLLLFNASVISLIKALSWLYAACSSAVVCYIF